MKSIFLFFASATIIVNCILLTGLIHTAQKSDATNFEVPNSVSQPKLSRSLRLVPNVFKIKVVSSKQRALVTVDGTNIVDDTSKVSGRGIHVIILNQVTGSVMAQKLFDTYLPHEDEAMVLFLSMVSQGRIIVLCVKDEASFHLKTSSRQALKALGSKSALRLGWRDSWAIVLSKGDKVYAESIAKSPDFKSWGKPVTLMTEVPVSSKVAQNCSSWKDENDEVGRRRYEFCSRYEGYGSVCSCKNPSKIQDLNEKSKPILNNQIFNVPVAIIASSNRPMYLYRTLRTLLSTSGADRSMITVFIDGFHEEPLAVTKLFGLRGVQHSPSGDKNARISQHYKASLRSIFEIYLRSRFVIVLEEDLTLHLLDEDPSLYCISAWNDQGYLHSAENPRQLYRIETMPGLGWMMKKSLFKDELENQWPTAEKMWDWDMWMRTEVVRKGRECIIPDISRTFHFGSTGLNMNSYFQETYFRKHAFSTEREVLLDQVQSLIQDQYEDLVHSKLKSGHVIVQTDYLTNCTGRKSHKDINVNHHYDSNVLFISMVSAKDYSAWLQFAKCFQIWDLDARGFHKGLWRLTYERTNLFIVGVPFSSYSIYKPLNVIPLSWTTPKQNEMTKL